MEIFIYEGNKLNTINKNNDIWFRAKTVALILKYSNHRKAIIDHVDPEDKSLLNEINIGGNESLPLTWNDKNSIYINEKALLNVTLGENQINSNMRLRSYNLGYQKGSPDLIIQNLHKSYSGFAIEFKSPQGYGNLSEYQNVMLQEYTNNGFKVLLNNDYDKILKEIIHYFDDIRILCSHCFRKFKSSKTLKNHTNYIHRYKQKMIYSFI